MQWKKTKNLIQVQFWVWVRTKKRSNMANLTGKLGAPDTENVSKQQSNNTQDTVTHSGLWSKKTH